MHMLTQLCSYLTIQTLPQHSDRLTSLQLYNNSITCQQNDYLSINGHEKTKETSKLKNVNFKKGIGIERYSYTIHHSHFDS